MASSSAAPPLSTLLLTLGATTLLLGFVLPISEDLLLTSAIPPLSTHLSPPYLFFAINLIILAIWKLSSTSDHAPTRELVTASTIQKQQEEEKRLPRQGGGVEQELHSDDSCVTSDADELPLEETWRSVRAAAAEDEKAVVAFEPDAAEMELCSDEMDRKFEAFIRKVNEQMRLQRLE